MSDKDISDRARVVLKALIERHIRDGQPVGSRTLQEEAGLPVSTATIRNVMSDLEDRGLLDIPPYVRWPHPHGFGLSPVCG